jgi:hypothetical protein
MRGFEMRRFESRLSLHREGYAFEFGLDVLGGAAGNFNAGRGGASLVMGDAVATAAEEVGDDFRGLERIDAGLQELIAQRHEVGGGELLDVSAVIVFIFGLAHGSTSFDHDRYTRLVTLDRNRTVQVAEAM